VGRTIRSRGAFKSGKSKKRPASLAVIEPRLDSVKTGRVE
jgi:hypothetical protein